VIEGTVSEDGVPRIEIALAGRTWLAIVDTGFNGDLELPRELQDEVMARQIGTVQSSLAGGVTITEDYFEVRFPFDGRDVVAEATFVDGNELLIGTRLMRSYKLEIDFPMSRIELRRTT
jgi:predicted aspartyl protease